MNPSSTGPVMDAIRQRRSARSFTGEAVPDEVIESIAEAALHAPTAGNKRMCRLIAIRDAAALSSMADAVSAKIASLREHVSSPRARQQFDGYAAHFTHFAEAPCVIVVLAKPYDSIYQRILRKYVPDDAVPAQELVHMPAMSVAAAIENMLLAATELGYGACFMTGPLIAQRELGTLLRVESPWHAVALVPVGRPATMPGERDTPPLDDFLEMR